MASDKEVIFGAARGNVQRTRFAAMLQVLNIVVVAKRLQDSIANDETADGAQTRKECLENLGVSLTSVATFVGLLDANLDFVEGIERMKAEEAAPKATAPFEADLNSGIMLFVHDEAVSEFPLKTYTDEANEDTEDFVEDDATDARTEQG